MITLCTGALPKRKAVGVFQVIQYLRELAGLADNDSFNSVPDTIVVPAVRISMPGMSFCQEMYGNAGNEIYLRILDRNERDPKIMLFFGKPESQGLTPGDSRMSFVGNPFRDIKRIEEYDYDLAEDPDVKYALIKVCFEQMDITFLKWK
jgi:hypothetical protein